MNVEGQVKSIVLSLVSKVTFKIESEGVEWGKSLELMPVITIKEINAHRANAGKKGEIIAKTMDRGKKFKEERYLCVKQLIGLHPSP